MLVARESMSLPFLVDLETAVLLFLGSSAAITVLAEAVVAMAYPTSHSDLLLHGPCLPALAAFPMRQIAQVPIGALLGQEAAMVGKACPFLCNTHEVLG